MSELWLGAGFFLLVMTAVVGAGYFVIRRNEERDTGIPAGLSTEPSLPASRAVFVNLFRSIGETFPAAQNEKNPYRIRLASAGYRWPSALPVFYGIKCASSLFFAVLMATATLFNRGEGAGMLLPLICGAGLGFMVPDRVLDSLVGRFSVSAQGCHEGSRICRRV